MRCTPISEATIVGAATGAALTGMRPVVEIMFMDFLTLAMDQLANHAAKFRYMYGPQARVPLVVRTPAGGGRCYGATHSQSLEAWLLHVPGLKVVAPATPADAKGSADRGDSTTTTRWSASSTSCSTPRADRCRTTPRPSRSAVPRCAAPGRDVTLVAYSYYVGVALQAAAALAAEGIDAEVIDLRTSVPMDTDTVLDSVRKTGRLVCIEEGTRTGGVGAEIAARVAEDAYEYLDAPIRRVAAADTPIPFSPALGSRWRCRRRTTSCARCENCAMKCRLMQSVVLPILDANMTHGVVRAWFKREGDAVRAGEPLFEVETDKVNAEVEAEVSGVLRRIVAPEATRVPVLALLAFVGAADEAVPAAAPCAGVVGDDWRSDSAAGAQNPRRSPLPGPSASGRTARPKQPPASPPAPPRAAGARARHRARQPSRHRCARRDHARRRRSGRAPRRARPRRGAGRRPGVRRSVAP